MEYWRHVEEAFLDELEKIGGVGGWASTKILGAPLKTWGTRAAVGAVPGAITGGMFSREGEGLSGAAKGAVGGAALGMLGGGALQYRALSKVPGWKWGMGGTAFKSPGEIKAMKSAVKGLRGGDRRAYREATRTAFPGFGGSTVPAAAPAAAAPVAAPIPAAPVT